MTSVIITSIIGIASIIGFSQRTSLRSIRPNGVSWMSEVDMAAYRHGRLSAFADLPRGMGPARRPAAD